jgi:hypothetical protein
MKKYGLGDSIKMIEGRGNGSSPSDSPSSRTLEPAKPSILKSSKSILLKSQKSVTIHEDNKDQTLRVMTLDQKNNQQQTLVKAKSISEEPKGITDKFKKLFCGLKQPSKSAPNVVQAKDSQLEPQMEQLKILNRNLNQWESQEEKLSRLRARHRKSIKGLTLRKKVSIQTLPSPTVKKISNNTITSKHMGF